MVTQKLGKGLILFWSLAEYSDRTLLKHGWTAAGFGDCVPEERENTSVLKDALNEVFAGTHFLVRPLSTRNGYAVVRETRGSDKNVFTDVLTAKVFGSDPPVLTSPTGDTSKDAEIHAAYAKHAGKIPAQQVSSGLVRVVKKMSGVALRRSGGFYWVADDRAGQWQAVCDAIELAAEGGRSTGYTIAHELDASAVQAVRDAIVAEVFTEAKRLNEEILSGELGDRAVRTRKAEARTLREKVEQYEEILSTGLTFLKDALDKVDQANAVAALLLASGPFDPAEEQPNGNAA